VRFQRQKEATPWMPIAAPKGLGRTPLGSLDAIGEIWLALRDEALIGLR